MYEKKLHSPHEGGLFSTDKLGQYGHSVTLCGNPGFIVNVDVGIEGVTCCSCIRIGKQKIARIEARRGKE